MLIKFLLKFFLFVSLAAVQIFFISGLPFWLREFNVFLVFLVFSLEFKMEKELLWWFMFVGFLFDIYYSVFFGLWLAAWPLMFVFSRWLYANFFTNRSLYSFLGLSFFATVFYYLFLRSVLVLADKAGKTFFLEEGFWSSLGWGLATNLLAVVAIFYLLNLATDRLKPVFLFKSK